MDWKKKKFLFISASFFEFGFFEINLILINSDQLMFKSSYL
jgi:hypothetical protein